MLEHVISLFQTLKTTGPPLSVYSKRLPKAEKNPPHGMASARKTLEPPPTAGGTPGTGVEEGGPVTHSQNFHKNFFCYKILL